jgi:hypothetical protein
MTEIALRWKRDGRGRQVTTDGRYTVETKGSSSRARWALWAVKLKWTNPNDHTVTVTIAHYPTMRMAKEHCVRHEEWRIAMLEHAPPLTYVYDEARPQEPVLLDHPCPKCGSPNYEKTIERNRDKGGFPSDRHHYECVDCHHGLGYFDKPK